MRFLSRLDDVALLALAAMAIAFQDPSVSLTLPGARVPVVLEAIGAQTGRKLSSTRDFQDEVLCVRLDHVSIQDVLDHIAGIVGGEWVASGQTLKLQPSMRFRRERRENGVQRRMLAMQTAAADAQKELQTQLPWKQVAAQLQNLLATAKQNKVKTDFYQAAAGVLEEQLPPANRLLRQIVSELPQRQIANLPDACRIVYSSQPTPMQVPFTPGIRRALASFAADEAAFERFVGPLMSQLPSGDDDQSPEPSFTPIPPGSRITLALTFQDLSDGGSLDLQIRNAKGESIAQDSLQISAPDEKEELTFKVDRSLDEPLPEDPRRAEFLRLISPPGTEAEYDARNHLLEGWRPMLLDPERFEPLAFDSGSRWSRLAQRLKVQFVGVLPDGDLSGSLFRKSPDRPSAILAGERESFEIAKQGTWLTIRPKDLEWCREERVSRSALGRFARQVAARQSVSVDDAAEFSVNSNGRFPMVNLPRRILPVLLDAGAFNLPGTELGLGLYGSLSLRQRRDLRGDGVLIAGLPRRAQDLLWRAVYLEGELSTGENEVEPTEALPTGIPPEGFLKSLSIRETTSVLPAKAKGLSLRTLGRTMTAETFGRAIARAEPGDLNAQVRQASNGAETYLMATIRTETVRVQLSPTVFIDFPLREASIDPNHRLYRLNELPADFRAAMETARVDEVKRRAERERSAGSPPPNR